MTDESAQEIDWNDIRERLSDTDRELGGAGGLSTEAAQRVLLDRARKLAAVPEAELAMTDIVEVMTFESRELFALETRFVRQVIPIKPVTSLPGAPAHLLGVTNLRGEVTAVFDLNVFFQIQQPDEDATQLLILGTEAEEFAIPVTRVHRVEAWHVDEVLLPPDSVSSINREYLKGVAVRQDADASKQVPVLLLEGATLLSDDRFYIHLSEA